MSAIVVGGCLVVFRFHWWVTSGVSVVCCEGEAERPGEWKRRREGGSHGVGGPAVRKVRSSGGRRVIGCCIFGGFGLSDSERERRGRWLHVVVGKREMGTAAVGSGLSPVRRVREG
ncbi:hypothetical protein HAX54_038599 [Datura stramonium]|uniref:Secreted protein n=1 Tax=Datura stramonium TaxID=4076 RepID=A0ABS8VK19_DATST|nr:hypothetical protein [Datura stramonium]